MNKVKMIASDGSKALGCYNCSLMFETSEQLDAHEAKTGHGPDYNPHAEGCAAGRADNAREKLVEEHAEFLSALRNFENAAFNLLEKWVETGAGEYPFEVSFDDVAHGVMHFRENVEKISRERRNR